jgi:hypothetical protein
MPMKRLVNRLFWFLLAMWDTLRNVDSGTNACDSNGNEWHPTPFLHTHNMHSIDSVVNKYRIDSIDPFF